MILHVSSTSQQKKIGRDEQRHKAAVEAICGGQFFFFAMMISILYVGAFRYKILVYTLEKGENTPKGTKIKRLMFGGLFLQSPC